MKQNKMRVAQKCFERGLEAARYTIHLLSCYDSTGDYSTSTPTNLKQILTILGFKGPIIGTEGRTVYSM